jgi:hypothetical protein
MVVTLDRFGNATVEEFKHVKDDISVWKLMRPQWPI